MVVRSQATGFLFQNEDTPVHVCAIEVIGRADHTFQNAPTVREAFITPKKNDSRYSDWPNRNRSQNLTNTLQISNSKQTLASGNKTNNMW